jgi:putative flippase GtrA
VNPRRRAIRGGVRATKFSLVGAINAAVDVTVLNALIWIYPPEENFQLVIYNGAALVAANLNSYFLNTRWTFRERAEHTVEQKVMFAVLAGINIAVASGVFWLMVRVVFQATDFALFLEANAAKAISMVVASTLSFFIMRYVVFKRTRLFNRWI